MKREDLTVVIEAVKEESAMFRECHCVMLHIDTTWRGSWQRLLSKSLGEVVSLKEINEIAEQELENLLKPKPVIETGDYDYLEIF